MLAVFDHRTPLAAEQALKALGKDKIDDAIIKRLGNLLTAEEKKTMLEEAKTATSWIYEYIKLICRS